MQDPFYIVTSDGRMVEIPDSPANRDLLRRLRRDRDEERRRMDLVRRALAKVASACPPQGPGDLSK
jgi:hypothetical protein